MSADGPSGNVTEGDTSDAEDDLHFELAISTVRTGLENIMLDMPTRQQIMLWNEGQIVNSNGGTAIAWSLKSGYSLSEWADWVEEKIGALHALMMDTTFVVLLTFKTLEAEAVRRRTLNVLMRLKECIKGNTGAYAPRVDSEGRRIGANVNLTRPTKLVNAEREIDELEKKLRLIKRLQAEHVLARLKMAQAHVSMLVVNRQIDEYQDVTPREILNLQLTEPWSPKLTEWRCGVGQRKLQAVNEAVRSSVGVKTIDRRVRNLELFVYASQKPNNVCGESNAGPDDAAPCPGDSRPDEFAKGCCKTKDHSAY